MSNTDANTGSQEPAPASEFDQRIDQMVTDGDGGAQAPTPAPDGVTQVPPSGQPPSGVDGQGGQAQPAGQQPPPAAPSADPAAPGQAITQQQRLGSDPEGNLVDGQGNVVAKAGKERRLWERVQRYEHFEVPEMRRQITELTNTAAQSQVLNNVPRQLGLNDEETLQGMKLIASYKKDPVATIQYILTEARAAGHNVQGADQGQVDLAAINRLLDQRLSPLLEDRTAQQQQQQANVEAERQYKDFTTRFPDVVQHEDVIARLLQHDPKLTAEAAYYQLRLWVQEHGLNWNQPLQAQVEAMQGGNTQQPIPPMAGSRSGNAPVVDTRQAAAVAGADADTADIVKEAMREAGMNPD